MKGITCLEVTVNHVKPISHKVVKRSKVYSLHEQPIFLASALQLFYLFGVGGNETLKTSCRCQSSEALKLMAAFFMRNLFPGQTLPSNASNLRSQGTSKNCSSSKLTRPALSFGWKRPRLGPNLSLLPWHKKWLEGHEGEHIKRQRIKSVTRFVGAKGVCVCSH